MLKGLKPVSWIQRLMAADLPYDMGIAAVSLIGGVAAGWRFWIAKPPDTLAAQVAWALAVVAFLIVTFKAVKNYRITANRHDDSPLEGLLHVIHSILESLGNNHDENMRIALYTRDETGPIQRTNYIGPLKPEGKDQRVTISEGVVGAAFRTGEESHSSLPSGTNVVDFLTSNQGFTREEAARRTPDRKSWIAVPVGKPGKVFAAVYCDSAMAGYFGNKSSQRRKVLGAAILGVADFLTRRYS